MSPAPARPMPGFPRSGAGVASEVRAVWAYPTVGLVSAASMALEIVAGRALAPYVGMSLYTWTVIIAVVLAGLSLGHWLGGVAADRTVRPSRLVASLLSGAAIASVISLRLLGLTEPLVGAEDAIAHVGALALAAFFLPSMLAGTLSPLLTKMALDAAAAGRQGRVLGAVFALGAGGAILGTLMAGLVLISWLGTAGSVTAIAALYALLSLPFWRQPVAAVLVLAGGALAIAAPGRVAGHSPCLEESAYYCIRVDDVDFLGREARVMALDHLVHGVNDAHDPAFLLSPYVQGVDEIVRRRFAGPDLEAFFIGGGAYSLPRAWDARYDAGGLLVAELDPAVTRIARQRLWLPEAVAVVHADARAVLAALPPEQRFDVIFGDAFHDISVPPHLVTDEFHALIAARLKPGGLYAVNVVDALRAPRLTLSLTETLGRRFASVELWLDLAEIGPDEARTTWIVIASDSPTGASEIEASHGPGRTWVRVPLGEMLATMPAGSLVMLTDDYAPVDRLLAAVLLDRERAE